jgi:hypothetical protein
VATGIDQVTSIDQGKAPRAVSIVARIRSPPIGLGQKTVIARALLRLVSERRREIIELFQQPPPSPKLIAFKPSAVLAKLCFPAYDFFPCHYAPQKTRLLQELERDKVAGRFRHKHCVAGPQIGKRFRKVFLWPFVLMKSLGNPPGGSIRFPNSPPF